MSGFEAEVVDGAHWYYIPGVIGDKFFFLIIINRLKYLPLLEEIQLMIDLINIIPYLLANHSRGLEWDRYYK